MIASQVQIKLLNEDFMGEFYFCKDQSQLARTMLTKGEYREAGSFAIEGTDTEAAEAIFDLTNNPGRQSEREQLYGRGRSVSVGDIVEVNGKDYLCASLGWVAI